MNPLLITPNTTLLSPSHGTHLHHDDPAHHYPTVCGSFSFGRPPMLVCTARSASHIEFDEVLFELGEWVSCPQCRARYQADFAAAALLPGLRDEVAQPRHLTPN
ncbi:hypothetical protein [Hymenobacter coccineus]|uniref:Uncharacterized protein n=1 Tax=Hymenobacter coccineus TaxID=1908235 RepID=A0A1G1SVT1_9BACT|nr:hypothetical protein [Hymenobacter coccineus]OGX82732.1 hypothetical protein BEN49_02350 [Hymenobacter coccineus]